MNAQPATTLWFVRHELLLTWRDWMAMMTAGRSAREHIVTAGVMVFVALLHLLAYAVLREPLAAGIVADKGTLVFLAGTAVLSFSLMLSQAIESITRAFYSRADLDLILSSPASARKLFAVRVAAIVLSTSSLSLFLTGPFINMAVVLDGSRWLVVYPVIVAMSAIATAAGLLITVAMFRTVGPKYTRFVAQVVAAVVGAFFLISTQVAAILYFGSYLRTAVFSSDAVVAWMPAATSPVWLPVRALLGEPAAAAVFGAMALAALAVTVGVLAGGFSRWVVEAAGVAETRRLQAKTARPFRAFSARRTLRMKEWQLLGRDPWLVSQSLMQIFYLIPPALMVWQSYGDHGGALVILVPILVMAVGQLSGGLAWLAVSGEDAPDLMASAPVPRGAITVAKIEALLVVIGTLAAPFVLFIAFLNPWAAAATAGGVGLAAASAVLIQLWHKTDAPRSSFRRRQTASKAATFCEAFSSIMWAGTALLVAAGSWFAALFGALAVCVLVVAWLTSVRQASHV
jgi:ABC-2 type transport system permease protein